MEEKSFSIFYLLFFCTLSRSFFLSFSLTLFLMEHRKNTYSGFWFFFSFYSKNIGHGRYRKAKKKIKKFTRTFCHKICFFFFFVHSSFRACCLCLSGDFMCYRCFLIIFLLAHNTKYYIERIFYFAFIVYVFTFIYIIFISLLKIKWLIDLYDKNILLHTTVDCKETFGYRECFQQTKSIGKNTKPLFISFKS